MGVVPQEVQFQFTTAHVECESHCFPSALQTSLLSVYSTHANYKYKLPTVVLGAEGNRDSQRPPFVFEDRRNAVSFNGTFLIRERCRLYADSLTHL